MVGSVGVRDRGRGQRLSLRGGSWMKARDRLSHTWRELARRHGCETTCAEIVLDELLRAYSEPNRLYHAIEHIGSLLSQLEEHGNAVIDSDAVVLAILFHDVVYNPLRQDNEEKSAALAGARLAFLGFPGGVIAKVEQYINGTKHAQDFVTGDCDLAVLLDLAWRVRPLALMSCTASSTSARFVMEQPKGASSRPTDVPAAPDRLRRWP
jgi:predicted metal-dependent HD superfamily phosphohydrolase